MKIFIAYSSRDRELVETLVTLLREDGHIVFHAAEMAATANLLSEISAMIRSADVLIAVVTTGNANVFYELGLAAGAGVPTLISARTGEILPADLFSIPYVQLTGDIFRDSQVIAKRVKELEGLSSTIKRDYATAEAELLAAARDASVLEALAPADFERLVAKLFKERGYEVTATSASRDAGVDVIVKSPSQKDVILVEIKKLSKQSRVSVEAVRQLLGAVELTGATLGMLVASSGFTAASVALAANTRIVLRTLEEVLAAKSETDLLPHSLSLRQEPSQDLAPSDPS